MYVTMQKRDEAAYDASLETVRVKWGGNLPSELSSIKPKEHTSGIRTEQSVDIQEKPASGIRTEQSASIREKSASGIRTEQSANIREKSASGIRMEQSVDIQEQSIDFQENLSAQIQMDHQLAILANIQNLMFYAACTASQAMDMLGISPFERSQYLAKL